MKTNIAGDQKIHIKAERKKYDSQHEEKFFFQMYCWSIKLCIVPIK